MTTHIHLVKLSVGTEGVDDLAAWQKQPQVQTKDGFPCHVTRMRPKREPEILAGGSIYWVIKGQIQARQQILRLDEVDRGDGIRRCAIVLDPEIHRTASALRRPFQGWRYLDPEDAPADLPKRRDGEEALPPELSAALADIGLL
ncbi:lysophospholipase [Rhodobacterales bacterium 59_46_T64]|nr:lysophospholipase [Rhodobacterales bacterium 59_46_T64]